MPPPEDYDPEEENQDSEGAPAPADMPEQDDRYQPGQQQPSRIQQRVANNLKAKAKKQAEKRTLRRLVKGAFKPGAKQVVAGATRGAGTALVAGASAIGGTGLLIALIVILIILLIIILIAIFAGGGSTKQKACQNEDANVTINKTGPESVANNAEIKYTISATYPGQATDITITETLPADTTFVSATGKYTEQKTGDKVTGLTWSAKENGQSQGGGQNAAMFPMQFDVVIKSDKPDVYVINKSTVSVSGGQATCCQAGGGTGGGTGAVSENYVPPSANDCGKAEYKASMSKNPTHKNFGDPNCSFDKNKLHEMLKQKDPQTAERWFTQVIPNESCFNPNSFVSSAEIGTPDSAGAWGLYQMGSSKPPGQAPPAPGKNGPNDRGDVNWEVQTTNAVEYLKKIKKIEGYWEGARKPGKKC